MAAKYRVLADRLREELGRSSGKQGYKLPTELELTARYQLSRQTVRHALRLLEEEGLIHRRQGSGSYATGLTPSAAPRQIAVVASFMDDYIFPAILHEATEVFSRQGYSTAVYATENRVSREREILLRLLEEPMSGLLVEGSKTALPTPNGDLYQRLRQAGTPMVFLHGAYGDYSDWARLTGIERYAQAHKIAVVMPSADNSFYQDMYRGGKYLTYFTRELPDYIARLFPVSTKREDTFVAGLSMGGYGAVRVAFEMPERFGAAASLSALCPQIITLAPSRAISVAIPLPKPAAEAMHKTTLFFKPKSIIIPPK